MSEDVKVDGYRYERIEVIGAGGVGFWMAIGLKRDLGDFPIRVWDDDTFEGGTGDKRLPRVQNVHAKKVSMLRGWGRMVMGDRPVETVEKRFNGKEEESWTGALIVDCTDSPILSRKRFWNAAIKRGAVMMRVSYDGIGPVVVSRGLPMVSKDAVGGGGGYASIPNMGQTFTAAGLGAQCVLCELKGIEWENQFVSVLPLVYL